MPGPPPKPTEVKRRTGNPGHRPLPTPMAVLPAARLGVPRAPSTLKKDGKAAWRRLWGVGHAWLSPATDWDIMVRLCEAHDERAHLKDMIRQTGHFTRGSAGQHTSSPAVLQLRTLESLMTRWESLCGFTPSDRSRLGLAEVKAVSKIEELMARRRERVAGD